ncbi:MAG: redoxin domain-containing protein [Opitutus sp.]
MTTAFVRRLTAGFSLALVFFVGPLSAALYRTGDTVQNFTLTDRATGREVTLEDFAGKIVFLEWFAWWCPFCQAAAPQVRQGIVDYYKERGGNPAGVPVLHVALNLQSGQETETQQFIDAYRVGQTLNDFDRTLANRFQSTGQPIFAIINGVAGSASHRQWELVFTQLGYGSTQAPITDFRQAIDSVKAAAVVTPPNPTPSPTGAPVLVSGPRDLTVRPGQPAQFFAVNTGGAVTYSWSKDGTLLPGATAAALTLDRVSAADGGRYSVTLTNTAGSVVSTAALLTVDASATSSLVNVATRANAGTGANSLIAGFVITGGPKDVLVRAAGPALTGLGVPEALADPRLELFSGPSVIQSNDEWSMAANAAEVAGTFTRLGAFPWTSGSHDAAVLTKLAPGAYTALASGANAGTGVALIEIYDGDTAGAASRGTFVNLATRGNVGTGANVMIAGFVVTGTAAKTLLLRAAGPVLRDLGVDGFLVDPVLTLFSGSQSILVNNDWGDAPNLASLRSATIRVGAFALADGSKDAAMLVTLPPGGYTVQASGAGGTSGVALMEIYDVPN